VPGVVVGQEQRGRDRIDVSSARDAWTSVPRWKL
jgi:hypothetical protein